MPSAVVDTCCGEFLAPREASFFSTLCRIEGSIFPMVFLKSLMFAGVGGVAFALYSSSITGEWFTDHLGPNSDLHTYMGILVSLMLSFRTNSCFLRYVEGIRVSNTLKVNARNIMMQAAAFIDGDDEAATALLTDIRRLLTLYCVFFKRHLHDQDMLSLCPDSFEIQGDHTLTVAEIMSLQSCTNGEESCTFIMLCSSVWK